MEDPRADRISGGRAGALRDELAFEQHRAARRLALAVAAEAAAGRARAPAAAHAGEGRRAALLEAAALAAIAVVGHGVSGVAAAARAHRGAVRLGALPAGRRIRRAGEGLLHAVEARGAVG